MKILTRCMEKMKTVCAAMLDPRRGKNIRFTMQDIGMSAFGIFFMQEPSFLARQRALSKGKGFSNAHTLFKVKKLPSDNHIRQVLDKVSPTHFYEMFRYLLETIDNSGGLAGMRRLDDRLLIALDGTEYFNSYQIGCDNCSKRKRSNGKVENHHQVLAATVVAPGQSKVIPLEPEFILPQDGHDKQDCETEAAKRWMKRVAPNYADHNPVYLGDDLFARQPMVEAIQKAGGSFILTCKPSSHETLYEFLYKPCTYTQTRGVKNQKRTYIYRWARDLPLRGGDDALLVNWLSLEIRKPNGDVTYRGAWVTDLDVNASNIEELVLCARTRWKIENENFNVLKNGQGSRIEHNFGHGKKNLSSLLLTMNLIAFSMHNAYDLIEPLWKKARQLAGPRYQFFQDLHFPTKAWVFSSWEELMLLLIRANSPRAP